MAALATYLQCVAALHAVHLAGCIFEIQTAISIGTKQLVALLILVWFLRNSLVDTVMVSGGLQVNSYCHRFCAMKMLRQNKCVIWLYSYDCSVCLLCILHFKGIDHQQV